MELTEASATALARSIRVMKCSAADVARAHLERIEAVDPRLNAVVRITADAALAMAMQLEDACGVLRPAQR